MGATEFGTSHDLTRKVWAADLAVEAEKAMYFRKFMGTSPDNVIRVKTELSKEAGDRIRVGLEMKLAGDGVEDDEIIEGTTAEEALTYYADDVYIGQRRKGTKSKGKMSEQRVPYNMRVRGRNALAVWHAEDQDEQIMIYLAGARGIDTSFHVGLAFTGRANNTLQTPDSGHVIYGGNATGLADIDSADKMTLNLIERALSLAETTDPMMQPFSVNGAKKFVLLMHNYQAYSLRTGISQSDWLEIHKATDGVKSPIYMGGMGEYAGVVMHVHRNVIRFDSTTGCASGVTAARALFLGRQAGLAAYGGGTPGEGRYNWNEETDDRGNAQAITAGVIYGVKKARFNSADFGVIAVDTCATNPNA
jgi:N4-gp56 family major capsid protein